MLGCKPATNDESKADHEMASGLSEAKKETAPEAEIPPPLAPSIDDSQDKKADGALTPPEGAQLPKMSRDDELNFLKILEDEKILLPGQSFIVETPSDIFPYSGASKGVALTCYSYRIGENHEDHFVTLTMVFYCPKEDKIFRYDVIEDAYSEVGNGVLGNSKEDTL